MSVGPLVHASSPVNAESANINSTLRLDGVSLKYHPEDRRPSVHKLTLELSPHSHLGILGPSGVGKTSILRVASGLISMRGSVLTAFLGSRVTGTVTYGSVQLLRPHPDFAYLPQQYERSLFPWMTLVENVALPLRCRGSSRNNATMRAREALDYVQLGSLANRFPRELSGGTQQRAVLARALVTKPQVLFLDEPFGALDPFLRAELNELLQSLFAKKILGSIVRVTHNVQDACMYCDRLLLVRNGYVPTYSWLEARNERDAVSFDAEEIMTKLAS